MHSTQRINSGIALFLVLFFSVSTTQAMPEISGYLELDSDYLSTFQEKAKSTTDSNNIVIKKKDLSEVSYDQGGFGRVKVSARRVEKSLFAAGEANAKIGTSGFVVAEDVFVKIGSVLSAWDVQLGRFEALPIYKMGTDVLLVNAPKAPLIYQVDAARGRNPGGVALHYGVQSIQLELNIVYGKDASSRLLGYRPLLYLTFGPVHLRAAYEAVSSRPFDIDSDQVNLRTGLGGMAELYFKMIHFGINYTSASDGGKDVNNKNLDKEVTTSIGGFATLNFNKLQELGIGYHATGQENTDTEEVKAHNQWFLSYSQPLPIPSTLIKLAYSSALAAFKPKGAKETYSSASGLRLRLNYSF